MSKKKILRLISLLMLAAAAVFVYYAVSSPTLGRAIQIGEFTFGAEHWRICYVLYILIMIILFAVSFLAGEEKK